MKVYVLRERCDWHNDDPYDNTKVFKNKEKVIEALAKAIADTQQMFEDEDIEISASLFEEEGVNWIETTPGDCYSAWFEEVEME